MTHLPWMAKNHLCVFIMSLALSLIGTVLIRGLARRLGVLDEPGGRKIHEKPVPRLGGIAIYAAYAIASMYGSSTSVAQAGIVIAGLIPLSIGIFDDVERVPAVTKLLALVLASIIGAHYGILLTVTDWHWLNVLLTVIWVVGVTSAFNALDNMDGLAAGVAFIAAAAYFVVALQTFQHSWGVLAAALMGATLGFLRYNFKPASIFMGDSGSFFLGFTLAAMAVMGAWSTHRVKASIIPLLILGVPLADLAYVLVVRRRNHITQSLKEIITFCGRDHFSHRLVDLGMSERRAVLFIYLVCACVGLGAVVLRNARAVDAVLLLAQFLMIMGVIVGLMTLVQRHDSRAR